MPTPWVIEVIERDDDCRDVDVCTVHKSALRRDTTRRHAALDGLEPRCSRVCSRRSEARGRRVVDPQSGRRHDSPRERSQPSGRASYQQQCCLRGTGAARTGEGPGRRGPSWASLLTRRFVPIINCAFAWSAVVQGHHADAQAPPCPLGRRVSYGESSLSKGTRTFCVRGRIPRLARVMRAQTDSLGELGSWGRRPVQRFRCSGSVCADVGGTWAALGGWRCWCAGGCGFTIELLWNS